MSPKIKCLVNVSVVINGDNTIIIFKVILIIMNILMCYIYIYTYIELVLCFSRQFKTTYRTCVVSL